MKKAILSFTLLATAYCILFFSHSLAETKCGTIIILDGTSTAGKTSIAKHLAPLLDPSYVQVALDDFITEIFLEQTRTVFSENELRRRINKLSEEELRDRVHEQVDKMYDRIRALVLEGKNVLLDTVLSGLVGENDAKRCFEKLKGLTVVMVLVYCPLPVITQRIKKRNKEAVLENRPGQIRPMIVSLKFGDIYRPASYNDIAIDTLSYNDIALAYKPSAALSAEDRELFNWIKLNLISQFGLNNKESIKLTPQLVYDCIVNTNKQTPQACAQQIYDYLALSDMSAFKTNGEKWIKTLSCNFCFGRNYDNLQIKLLLGAHTVIEKDKQVLVRIITKHLPQAKIYLFGSRARKNHTPESDIDIALDNNKKIDPLTLSAIKEEVEESTIPFTVDIIDLHSVSEDFKKQILKDGKLWH